MDKKLKAGEKHAMTPIVCVGETLEEREAGATDERVTSQTNGAFAGVKKDDAATCIVAYEPIWAIGTGRNVTPDDANGRGAVDQVLHRARGERADRGHRARADDVRVDLRRAARERALPVVCAS